jgi:hopanoid-associated phosphorylase
MGTLICVADPLGCPDRPRHEFIARFSGCIYIGILQQCVAAGQGRWNEAGRPRDLMVAQVALRKCDIYRRLCRLEGREISQSSRSEIDLRHPPVIAVTSLALEARIARGPGVAVICDHASQLVSSLHVALGRGAAGIISFGVAAGLAPELIPGDCVIGTGVWTSRSYFPADAAWASRLLAALPAAVYGDFAGTDALLIHPAQKRALHARSGAVVADMESHIAARVAAERRIPFVACRVVIDPLDEPLPAAAQTGLRQDGRADLFAVLASLARHPAQLPALVRIAYHAAIARGALRESRRHLGAALACPHFSAGAELAAAPPLSAELALQGAGASLAPGGLAYPPPANR